MKLLLTAILFLALITTSLVPDPIQLGAKFDYNQLPDADLRQFAEEAWSEGREESAILLLDYIIEQGMPDAPSALSQQNEWLETIAARKSALGKLQAVGWGALSGKVDSMEAFTGAALTDLIVIGDIRDLFVELVLEDDTDELIVLLSTVGIVTTVFPPGEGVVIFLKAAKKSNALSGPLVAQLKRVLEIAKTSGGSTIAAANLKEIFVAFDALFSQCKSWAEATTLLKAARSLDEVKLLAKIAKSSKDGDGARRLAQMIQIAAKGGTKPVGDTLSYIQKHGEKGMDTIYEALRKGPKGLQFLAKHPTLSSRTLKNAKKGHIWAVNDITDFYHAAVIKHGILVVWAKRTLTAILWALLILLWVPRNLLGLFQKRGNAKGKGEAGRDFRPFGNQIAAAIGIILIVLTVYGLSDATISSEASAETFADSPRGGTINMPASVSSGASLGSTLSVGFLCLALLTQILIGVAGRSKIIEAKNDSAPSPLKRLQLLENRDVWLDLPLFAGLGFTVFAFILISLDAEMSRVLAYSSTVFGILSSVLLRLLVYQPARDELIRNCDFTESSEA